MKYLNIARSLTAHLFVRLAFNMHNGAATNQFKKRLDKETKDLLNAELQRIKNRQNMDVEAFNRRVSGALKDCINNHGPITKYSINSASKRMTGLLFKS